MTRPQQRLALSALRYNVDTSFNVFIFVIACNTQFVYEAFEPKWLFKEIGDVSNPARVGSHKRCLITVSTIVPILHSKDTRCTGLIVTDTIVTHWGL